MRMATRWLAAGCALALALAGTTGLAAEKRSGKKAQHAKIERLACRLGTEDRHARVAVEVKNDRVESFAYYSKWKPRTCSVHVERDDAYSHWQDYGPFTTVMTEKGTFLIEHGSRNVQFYFRNVDRMFYCGMDGRITGTLTVTRGDERCALEGVMDEDTDNDSRPGRTASAPL